MENKELQISNNNDDVNFEKSILGNLDNLPEEARNELIVYANKKKCDSLYEAKSDAKKSFNAEYDINLFMDKRTEMQMHSYSRGHDTMKGDFNTGSGRITIETHSGKCFVATATYQDAMHPDVILLRDFRDRFLRKSGFGRMFIVFYYKVGPYFAYFPERSLLIRKWSRCLIENIVLKIKDKYYK